MEPTPIKSRKTRDVEEKEAQGPLPTKRVNRSPSSSASVEEEADSFSEMTAEENPYVDYLIAARKAQHEQNGKSMGSCRRRPGAQGSCR